MRLRFRSAVLPDRVASPCDIVVRGARIAAVEPPRGRADEHIAALAIPGLVDLQVNGAFGVNFATANEERLATADRLMECGVTTLLPTVLTASRRSMREAAARWERVMPRLRVRVPGLHFEGPFLNPEAAGVHPVRHIRPPDPGEFRSWRIARMITLAPEMPGALPLIRATRDGVVSIGHARPTRVAYERAVAVGARFVTHLYNAMSGIHHRDGGLATWALADDRVACGLIYDRRHVYRDAAVIALRVKSTARLVLTSDQAAHGKAGRLSGSRSGILEQLRFAKEDLDLSWPDAVRIAAENPARLLGLRCGRLQRGFEADIVALSGARVAAVWRAGTRIL